MVLEPHQTATSRQKGKIDNCTGFLTDCSLLNFSQ